MIIDDIFSEIINISQTVIGNGLSVQENPPMRSGEKITWKGERDLSILLRKISYLEKYSLLADSENYNFKLLDGGLIQLQYTFEDGGNLLCAHRLAYFPSPLLERYESAPQEYEEKYFGESEYHDVFSEYTITFPIRFDYSSSDEIFKEIHHPYCHAHFGEFETCRIPLTSPISPNLFMNFILRNFYNTAIVNYCNDLHFKSIIKLNPTITQNEKQLLHFNFE